MCNSSAFCICQTSLTNLIDNRINKKINKINFEVSSLSCDGTALQ